MNTMRNKPKYACIFGPNALLNSTVFLGRNGRAIVVEVFVTLVNKTIVTDQNVLGLPSRCYYFNDLTQRSIDVLLFYNEMLTINVYLTIFDVNLES